jgi:hypothetical protein
MTHEALGPHTQHIAFSMSKGSTIVIYKSILFFSLEKNTEKLFGSMT